LFSRNISVGVFFFANNHIFGWFYSVIDRCVRRETRGVKCGEVR